MGIDMQTNRFNRAGIAAGVAALVLGAFATPALAQRDPAYEAARSAGQIGEKMDGYLGTIGSVPAGVQKIVSDLNIKRKAVYAQKAQDQHATVEEYAFTSGCLLISQTKPGEMYQAPGGSWQARGAGAPQRDPRCP